jgi:hypothetical protein
MSAPMSLISAIIGAIRWFLWAIGYGLVYLVRLLFLFINK